MEITDLVQQGGNEVCTETVKSRLGSLNCAHVVGETAENGKNLLIAHSAITSGVQAADIRYQVIHRAAHLQSGTGKAGG